MDIIEQGEAGTYLIAVALAGDEANQKVTKTFGYSYFKAKGSRS